ncbi:MAG: Lipid II:glycine glycyltransferase [Anaerolineales bacterium]|nr:Lipid II:glycine glycyltransferase [Anaerolineales bacterium]
MHFHLSTNAENSDWDTFTAYSPWGHLLQSSSWGQFKSETGWEMLRIAGRTDEGVACGAQMLLRSTPGGAVAYVPRGPIVAPDADVLSALLEALTDTARDRGAVFLKIEPDWPDDATPAGQLEALGFQPSDQTIQPCSTIVLNLRPDEDDILMGMKSKWRYNIRLAGRKDVQVRCATEDDMPAFYNLMETTSDRNEFAIHERGYYATAWQYFHPQGLAELFLAYYADELLAGLMAFRFGDTAYYLYGASSNQHRNRMPNHLLQWRAIQWAKQNGCTQYDFWGIPDAVGEAIARGDDVENKRGGMWGVYRFKRGFGGDVARTAGAFDRVFKPAHYWVGTRVWPRVRQWVA